MRVDVSGGQLLGLGNGCPYHERSYLGNVTDTYYGEALAVIRPEKPGQITVTVSDGNLRAQAYVAVQ